MMILNCLTNLLVRAETMFRISDVTEYSSPVVHESKSVQLVLN